MKKYMLAFLIIIPIMLPAWNMSDSAEESTGISDSTREKIESSWAGILQGTDEIILGEIEATKVSEMIELEWTSTFCDGPVTVVAKETYYNADGSIDGWSEYEYDGTGNHCDERIGLKGKR